MHSTVFELSDYPIPAAQQATPGYLPDWFFCSVCDYATRMTDTERENSITALVNSFGASCSRSGDCLTFAPSLRDTYFRESLRYFKAAAAALSETDYETFAGIVIAPAFTAALNGIRVLYLHAGKAAAAGQLAADCRHFPALLCGRDHQLSLLNQY